MRDRLVANNVLVSTSQPRIQIGVEPRLSYVGSVSLSLGTAEAELFAFASRIDGELERLFYAQFEAVRPEEAWSYRYQIEDTMQLGSHSYMHDIACRNVTEVISQRPRSDIAGIYRFLSEHGYGTPDEVLRHRFVRVLDETRRSEILFIYAESLSAARLTCQEIVRPEGESLLGEFKARSMRSFWIVAD